MKFSILVFIYLTVFGSRWVIASEIRQISYDLSKSESINMIPGRATSITLPCKIADVFSGASSGLKKMFSTTDPRRMALRIDNYSEKGTNLIFHCEETNEVILLEVLNKKPHLDVLIISSTFGSPNSNFQRVSQSEGLQNRKIIDSSSERGAK